MEYIKPEIADYGDLKELTAACLGEGADLGTHTIPGSGADEAEYFSGFICHTEGP
jgi:hypothetical protein